MAKRKIEYRMYSGKRFEHHTSFINPGGKARAKEAQKRAKANELLTRVVQLHPGSWELYVKSKR